MSVPPISLEDFQASSQASISSGGPWIGSIIPQNDESQCSSQKEDWCGGYCLTCAVLPSGDLNSYVITFRVNVSVSLDVYGSPITLDFEWSFWPLFCGSNISAGTSTSIHSQIGDAAFDDALVAVDYSNFLSSGHSWSSSPQISHTGSTHVELSADGRHGYIPLIIGFVMKPGGSQESRNLYVKGINFAITSPLQSTATTRPVSTPPISLNVTISSSLPIGGQSASLTPPLPSLPSMTGNATALSGNSPGAGFATPQTQLSAPAIVGVSIGSLVAVALLSLVVLLWIKRRKPPLPLETRAKTGDTTVLPFEKADWVQTSARSLVSEQASTPFGGTTSPGSVNQIPPSSSRTPLLSPPSDTARSTSTRPVSIPPVPLDPPPLYYNAHRDELYLQVPSPSSSLARFADSNRALINEDLEARLVTAGYVPTDDPDGLTEYEWMTHGITKLELLRLRQLFLSNRQGRVGRRAVEQGVI